MVDLPAGESLRTWLGCADLSQQRQVLSLLIDRVVVHPTPGAAQMRNAERFMGRWRFKLEHVVIRWRV